MMISPLALQIPIMPDEPAANYCSRLAARNFRSARSFAADMGLRFLDIVHGRREPLLKLAKIGGISAMSLDRNAMRQEDGKLVLREHSLDLNLTRRSTILVCPKCLSADIERSDLPPPVAVYGRIPWMFNSIRTCPVHALALISPPYQPSADNRHDWSLIMKPVVPRLSDLIDSVPHRSASEFEVYLINRLEGKKDDCWLDSLEFHAAEYFAELVGAVAAFGKDVSLRSMTEDARHQAGVVGFKIVKEGPKGIVDFLSQLDREYVQGRRTSGPSSVYGKLYHRLTHGVCRPAYASVHQIMTEHILSNFPIGPGDNLFGMPVETRRLHSIQTASKFYGIYNRRLRKVLEIEGLLPNPKANDHDILITVADAERLLRREKCSLTLLQAEERLNVSEVTMQVLLKAGFIHRHKVTSGKNGYRYFDYELDQFLQRLLIDAKPVSQCCSNVLQLRDAARHANRPLADVVRLILDRKLRWVGNRLDLKGFDSLVVKLDEIKALVRGAEVDGLFTVPAIRLLQVPRPTLLQIAQRGVIKTIRAIDPVNRRSKMLFPHAELERFRSEFISLYHLAKTSGHSGHVLRKQLAAQGVYPAEELAGVGATFYRKSELPLRLGQRQTR